MPRRPAKTLDLSSVLAANLTGQRERRDPPWSQETLAERMRELGFTNWSRVTVAQLEHRSGGRRRRLTVDEWLALGQAFDVSPIELLLPGPKKTVQVIEGRSDPLDDVSLVMLVAPPSIIRKYQKDIDDRLLPDLTSKVGREVARMIEGASADLWKYAIDIRKRTGAVETDPRIAELDQEDQ